jgi:chromosome segregation ATPase
MLGKRQRSLQEQISHLQARNVSLQQELDKAQVLAEQLRGVMNVQTDKLQQRRDEQGELLKKIDVLMGCLRDLGLDPEFLLQSPDKWRSSRHLLQLQPVSVTVGKHPSFSNHFQLNQTQEALSRLLLNPVE